MRPYVFALPLMLIAATAAAAEEPLPGLSIQLGERWIFHVENGQPAGARKAGPDDKAGPDELIVTLSSQGGTMMSVTNNGATWYNYHAFMSRKVGEKGQRTSVCTLMGGGRGAFESWPNTIPVIRIADFTPTDPGSMACQ